MTDPDRKSRVFLVGERQRAEALRLLLRTVPRFECTGAFTCAQSALAALEPKPPDVMLLLMDRTGPLTTELVGRIRKQRPGLPVIVCLGSNTQCDVLAALAAGAVSILIEPIRPHDLAVALESAARGGSFLCAKTHLQMTSTIHVQRIATTLSLSRRQADVIERLLQGLSDKEIASQLGIAESTVRTHLRALYRRLDVHTRRAARAKLIGFEPPDE